MRSVRLIAVAATCVASVICACGDSSDGDAGGSSREENAVVAAIGDFYTAFTRADGAKACSALTPKLRREFVTVAVRGPPSLKGGPCASVFAGFYERVPPK